MSPILTVTGSDPAGGSGIQADIKTISALGGVVLTAITSVTVQNTLGIQEFFDVPAEVVRGQIEAVVNDMQPQIVKIGMIRSVDVLDVIVDMLTKYRPRYVIYTPVAWSTGGERLMDDRVISQIKRRLLPLCTLVCSERHGVHGESNVYGSALAFYLSRGDTIDEAQEKAAVYMQRLLSGAAPWRSRGSELYHEFLSEVELHVKTNNDVAFYAERLNVSPRYLAQVCRKLGMKTPKQVIDETLIREIQKALRVNAHTVQEVAYTFGFSSQAHFTKYFKKLCGMTPSQFRKAR